jgi:hypothetical protein
VNPTTIIAAMIPKAANEFTVSIPPQLLELTPTCFFPLGGKNLFKNLVNIQSKKAHKQSRKK